MGLAVAVRIASTFTGRINLLVLPYLLERLIHIRHEPSIGLPRHARCIEIDSVRGFITVRLDRSMGSGFHPKKSTGVGDNVGRITGCLAPALVRTTKIIHEIINPSSIINKDLKILASRTGGTPLEVDETLFALICPSETMPSPDKLGATI